MSQKRVREGETPSTTYKKPCVLPIFHDYPFDSGTMMLDLEADMQVQWPPPPYDTLWPIQHYIPASVPLTPNSVCQLFRATRLILDNCAQGCVSDVGPYVYAIVQRLEDGKLMCDRANARVEVLTPLTSDVSERFLSSTITEVSTDLLLGDLRAALHKTGNIRASPLLRLWWNYLLACRGVIPRPVYDPRNYPLSRTAYNGPNTTFCHLNCLLGVLPKLRDSPIDTDLALELIKVALRLPDCNAHDHKHEPLYDELCKVGAGPLAMLVACRSRHFELHKERHGYYFFRFMSKVFAASKVVLTVNPDLEAEDAFQSWLRRVTTRDLDEYYQLFDDSADVNRYAMGRFDTPPPSLAPSRCLEECKAGWSCGRDSAEAFTELGYGPVESVCERLFTPEFDPVRAHQVQARAGTVHLPWNPGLYSVKDFFFYLLHYNGAWLVVSLPVKFSNMHNVAHERYHDRRRTIMHAVKEAMALYGEKPGDEDNPAKLELQRSTLHERLRALGSSPVVRNVNYQDVYSVRMCVLPAADGRIAIRPDFMPYRVTLCTDTPDECMRSVSVQLLKTVPRYIAEIDLAAAAAQDLRVCGVEGQCASEIADRIYALSEDLKTLGFEDVASPGIITALSTRRESIRFVMNGTPRARVDALTDPPSVDIKLDVDLVRDLDSPGRIVAKNTHRARAATIASHTTRAIYAAGRHVGYGRYADRGYVARRYMDPAPKTVLPNTMAFALRELLIHETEGDRGVSVASLITRG